MLKYITRRLLQMIVTVFGVILITFGLFNVVPNDPGQLKLGQKARPKQLEEYDIRHGLNKPLFFGKWGKTRAFQKNDFSVNAGAWSSIDGVTYSNRPGRVVLAAGREYAVPMSLPFQTNSQYRWVLECRIASAQGSSSISLQTFSSSNLVKTTPLPVSRKWTRQEYVFESGADVQLKFKLAVTNCSLELRYARLDRAIDNPFDSQFVHMLGQTCNLVEGWKALWHGEFKDVFDRTFDFGVSEETNQRVSRMITDGMWPSLSLTVPMFVVAVILEVILALVCAYFRNTFIDRFFVVVSVAMLSVPYLIWIIFGQYLFGYHFRLFPVWGYESARYLVLPCLIGILSGLGGGIRFYRTIMLDEMYRDYVRTAFAKGVSKPGVLFKHVLKNAMIPILTSVVVAIPFLYTGAMLLESFFGIPGIGNLAINAINNSDFDVIRSVVFIGAVMYVVANLATDIMYTLVDPRIRLK